MNDRRAPARITFDTNLTGVWQARAFWATLCEEINQKMVLTPTATGETLRRIRLEAEREWKRRLAAINEEQSIGWTRVDIRRLSTTAAQACANWFKTETGKQGNIYTYSRRTPAIEEREAEIDDAIADDIFDLTTDNGIRDRKIVVEAMARGFDILASNNVESIDHGMLRHWVRSDEARGLRITSTIERPEAAEERLRTHYGKPIEWTALAAARACVTDPEDPARSAGELSELISVFHERGMSELQARIHKLTRNASQLARILDHVRRHGASEAMRAERDMNTSSRDAVTRRSGIGL